MKPSTESVGRDRAQARGRGALPRRAVRARSSSPAGPGRPPRRGGGRRCGGNARPRPSRRLGARHGRRSREHDRACAVLPDDRARGPPRKRICGRRAVRAGAGRAVVRPPPPRSHPRLHARAQAGGGPADQPGGVGELPPVVVARNSRDEAPRPGRSGRGDRAASGVRDGRPETGSGCSRSASSPTSPNGSTTSASQVRSCGDGCQLSIRLPTAKIPPPASHAGRARRPRAARRSPSC